MEVPESRLRDLEDDLQILQAEIGGLKAFIDNRLERMDFIRKAVAETVNELRQSGIGGVTL